MEEEEEEKKEEEEEVWIICSERLFYKNINSSIVQPEFLISRQYY